MTQTRRWADPQSAKRYPLPVEGSLMIGTSEYRFKLPTLPEGTIVAPSFAAPGQPKLQWSLEVDDARWPLLPVPSTKNQRPDKAAPEQPISTHIDCWHTHAEITGAEVTLKLSGELPEHYLVTLSSRPLALTPTPPSASAIAREPRALSQMKADASLRHHICSPTSVCMLLPSAQLDTVVTQCRDVATGMFGSWPLAVRAAASYNAVGAVELMSSWDDAYRVLDSGLAFCASIRFEKGKLPGAPLERTGGHLVVVYGVEGDEILIHDPAAATPDEVPRRYPAGAFTDAWLAHRGASYIIAP